MKKIILILVGITIQTHLALCWGPQGHQTVAELSRSMLNDRARAAVTKILDSDDLASVATWADEVRAASRGKGPLVHDPEASAFNQKNPNNDQWHFVNLPLGTTVYTDTGPFSSPDDVVHAINKSIAVLEGKSTQMTKLQALRVIVHLTGDIHQPLHVGTGYFSFDDNDSVTLITAPNDAKGKSDDVGGNDLFYGPGRFDELHAYWDGKLVENIAHTSSHHKLVAAISNKVDQTSWKTPGDYHQWAEKWATDSVKEALAGYQGLKFSNPEFNTHHKLKKISIVQPDHYLEDQTPRVEKQILRAGFHLADLLNHINWNGQRVTAPKHHI